MKFFFKQKSVLPGFITSILLSFMSLGGWSTIGWVSDGSTTIFEEDFDAFVDFWFELTFVLLLRDDDDESLSLDDDDEDESSSSSDDDDDDEDDESPSLDDDEFDEDELLSSDDDDEISTSFNDKISLFLNSFSFVCVWFLVSFVRVGLVKLIDIGGCLNWAFVVGGGFCLSILSKSSLRLINWSLFSIVLLLVGWGGGLSFFDRCCSCIWVGFVFVRTLAWLLCRLVVSLSESLSVSLKTTSDVEALLLFSVL